MKVVARRQSPISRSESSRKRIVVFGLDVFAHKHRLQLQAMADHGFTYDVYVHDTTGNSARAFHGLESQGHKLHTLPQSTSAVMLSIISILRTRPLHVEFYTTNYRSMPMPFAAKVARVPLITVERGLVSVIQERTPLKRWILARAYRCSGIVMYREPHMAAMIKELAPGARIEFVPNAVHSATERVSFAERDIDFLWANRLLSDRYCEWLTEFSAAAPRGHRKTVVAGLRRSESLSREERAKQESVLAIRSHDVEVLNWVDPHPLMLRSRYFVMAARYTFGNNALLEAMSRGCVPIVSRAPGIELLIQDGVNGFLCDLNEQDLHAALAGALDLSERDWTRMSVAAQRTVREKFSFDNLSKDLLTFYHPTF